MLTEHKWRRALERRGRASLLSRKTTRVASECGDASSASQNRRR